MLDLMLLLVVVLGSTSLALLALTGLLLAPGAAMRAGLAALAP